MKAESTGEIQAGQFRPGRSGNPAGRPKGSRNKATLAMEALLDGEAEKLMRKAIDRALEGDTTALRLCLDRLLPPRRDRPICFTMPVMERANDAVKAISAITAAVAEGALTASEASEFAKLIECFVRTLEAHEFDQRLRSLENPRTYSAADVSLNEMKAIVEQIRDEF